MKKTKKTVAAIAGAAVLGAAAWWSMVSIPYRALGQEGLSAEREEEAAHKYLKEGLGEIIGEDRSARPDQPSGAPKGPAAAAPETAPTPTPAAPGPTPTEPPAAAAPQPTLSPYVDLADISNDKFGLLVEAIFNQRPLDFPDELIRSVDRGTPWQEWKSDNYQIKGDVERLILRFEHVGAVPEKDPPAPSFYVSVRFEEYRPIAERLTNDPNLRKEDMWRKGEGIVVKHDLPKKAEHAGGVRIPVKGDRPHRIMIEGRDRTGVVAVVPQSHVRGVRGIVLCTRDYDLWKLRGGVKLLDDTGYVLAGLQAEVSGSAQAKVKSGFGPGLARASVQVTRNVPPSRRVEDESRAIYPYASVTYMPRDVKLPPQPQLADKITAGIRVQTVLHNSLNHKTVSTGTVVMTVKKVEVGRNFYMTHMIGEQEIKFAVKAGTCYAVLKELKLEHEFIKEDLPQMPGEIQKGADLLNALQ